MSYFKPVNPREIPPRSNYGRLTDMLVEIMHTNCEAVEIDWHTLGYSTVSTASCVLTNLIRRNGFPLKSMYRKNKLFIVKKGDDAENG